MRLDRLVLLSLATTAAGTASAFTLDGQLDGAYGGPLAVQTAPTGYGDSNLGQIGSANGSELNAAYGFNDLSTLHLMLTGNLQSNFNRLVLFFDTGAAGQNNLGGFPNNNGGNNLNGMFFDSGFNASRAIVLAGDGNSVFVDGYTFSGGSWSIGFLGSTGYGSNGVLASGTNPFNVRATIDNRNTAGVTAASAANAQTATRGAELAIPLGFLGNPVGTVRVTAFIAGSNFVGSSNQFLGGLPSDFQNFGASSAIRLGAYAGDQFFAVQPVPEPFTMALGGAAAAAFIRKRRMAKKAS